MYYKLFLDIPKNTPTENHNGENDNNNNNNSNSNSNNVNVSSGKKRRTNYIKFKKIHNFDMVGNYKSVSDTKKQINDYFMGKNLSTQQEDQGFL